MIYLTMLFCFGMTILGKITEKRFLNPVTAFYCVWTLILFLTSLKLYGLNATTDTIYSYMFIGFLAFAIGYYLFRGEFKQKQQIFSFGRFRIGIRNTDSYILRYKIIYLLCFLTLIVYILDFSVSLGYLLSGNSLDFIRHMAQDSTSDLNVQSDILSAMKNVLISPFVLALQPIVAFDFWLGNRDKKLLGLDIIILLLRVLTDGSRSNVVYFVLHFILGFTFIYCKKQKKFLKNLKKKNKKIAIAVLIFGVVAILWITISRSGENAIKYAYYYFTMEPYMFEQWAEKADKLHLLGYGMASTNGFSFAVFYILKNLGLMSYPEAWHSINTIIGETQTQWMIISSFSSRANAYVSLFWYLYLDGRVVGIIIGMLIYGIIGARSYWTALKNMSCKAMCIYAFILQGLIMSFVRLQFGNIIYAVAFIMILCFYRRVKVKKE